MTISFSGLASGLDTTSWIESLVALKRAKVTTLQKEREEVLVSKDTLSSIKSFFTSFRNAIQKITDTKFNMVQMDLFAQNIATSANLNVLTATATAEAEEGTYRVKVDKLATKTSATSNHKYMTTIVETTTATANSKLVDIGVTAGNIGVTVSGVKYGVSITNTDTIATFIDKLKNIGVEASFNETTGVFTMNANYDDIDDIDNTQIREKLHLSKVNEGYETSSKLQYETTHTQTIVATETTELTDLGVGVGTITIEATGTSHEFVIADNTTIGDFVSALESKTIEADFRDGVFTLTDAVIADEGTTDIKSKLGLTDDVYQKYQQTEELTLQVTVTTTTTATSGTKLSELGEGITIDSSNNTIEVKNSNNEETIITIDEDTTIGSLLEDISNAGLYAAINNDGTIEIAGGTISGGTFDAVGVLGLESEPYTATASGSALTETVIEHKIVDLQTEFVKDLGVTEGYLEVTDADGNVFYEKIYAGQTIADFMADMGNLGIYTELDEETGVLEITGGAFRTLDNDNDEVGTLITNGAIVETDPSFPAVGTNLLECLYGSPVITTGHIEVASAYSRTRALTRSVTNTVNATTATTLGALGLTTEGTAEFNVRGDIRTINITSDMTIEELQNALTAQGIESIWDSDNARLTINNATLEGGTSDLADVLNLEETIAGKYVTSNALYATNLISSEATRESLLSQFGVSGDEEVVLYKEDGSTETFTVSGSTSLGTLLDTLNTMGVTATLANGIFNINDGYITNANVETALGLVKTTSGMSHVLGNEVTYTVNSDVTGASTLGSVISALGKEDEVSGGYSLVFNTTTLAVDSSTTLNSVIEQINSAGGSARLDSTGRIHVEGGSLTGTVAEALGFETTTITTAVSATGENLKTTVTFNADETTTLGELGINTSKFKNSITRMGQAEAEAAGYTWVTTREELTAALVTGDSSVKVMLGADIDLSGSAWNAIGQNYENRFLGEFDGNGYVIKNMTTSTNGSYRHGFFGYLGDGAVIKNLGFENAKVGATSNAGHVGVIATASNGNILVENCYVSNSNITGSSGSYSTGGIIGQAQTAGTLVIDSCCVFNSTFSGNIVGGVIGTAGVNVDFKNTDIYNIVNNGTTAGGVLAQATSGAVVDLENIRVYASGTNCEPVYGKNNSSTINQNNVTSGIFETQIFDIYDKNNNLLGFIDVNDSTSLGEIFTQLESYGINATIEDGIISLESTAGNYLRGNVAEALGISYDDMVFETSTVTTGMTATSTVGIIYTATVFADGTSTLDALGVTLIDKSVSFTNPVTRMTQSEAETAGYTWVTDRAGLTTALTNGENVMLGADIDLGDSEWTTIETYAGTFNGNGYVIKNLTKTSGSSGGIFYSLTAGATVCNLGLENFTINMGHSNSAGALAYSITGGTIENVYLNSSNISSYYAGGLVYLATDTVISGVKVLNANITSGYNAAGIVGSVSGTTSIIDSKVINTNITANSAFSYTGGLVGYNSGSLTIENSYVLNSTLKGKNYVGGFVGDKSSAGTLTITGGGISVDIISSSEYQGLFVGRNLRTTTVTGTSYDTALGYDLWGGSGTIVTSGTKGYWGYGNDLVVYNRYGDRLGAIDLDSTSTVNDMFSALRAYGIEGSINNGEIVLTSTDGNIVGGDIAEQLGINVVESGTVISTVNIAQTSTAKVTYSETIQANGTNKVSDYAYLGGFAKEIEPMTQAEAEAEGYTWVTTRAELSSALSANKNIVLGADIDLSGSNWNPVSKYIGILDGNGHTISNMTISSTASNVGFVQALDGEINNLAFEGVNITASSAAYIGVVAGSICYNDDPSVYTGSINNCFVKDVTIVGSGTSSYAGGITGNTGTSGTINNCVAQNINISNTYRSYALIGRNDNSLNGSNYYDTSTGLGGYSNVGSGGTPIGLDFTQGFDIEVYNSFGESIGTVDIDENTTLNQMLSGLSSYGIVGSIENGVIKLVSENGNYVGGNVAEQLGLNTLTLSSVVATTSSTMAELGIDTSNPRFVNKVNRMSQAEAESAGYTWVTTREELTAALVTGDSSVKVMLGADIDLSGEDWTVIGDNSNKFLGILDGNGYVIKNFTLNSSSMFNNLSNATISNLGIENANATNSDAILASNASNATIDNCYISNSNITNRGTSNIGAFIGSMRGGAIKNSNIYNTNIEDSSYESIGGFVGSIYGSGNTALQECTIENSSIYNSNLNGNVYVGSLVGSVEAYAGYFPTLNVKNCFTNASLSSQNDMAGSLFGFSDGTVNVENTIVTQDGLNDCGSGSINSGSTTYQADVGQYKTAGEELAIYDKNGSLLGRVDLGQNSSIGDIFTSLSAYGIVGSIDENGVITLSSADGKTVGGSIADQLGLEVSQRLTQTITTVATATSTMAEMGVFINPKFMNAIDRLSQAEAEAEGYTWVTTREELTTALTNNENVMLGADIDLSGENWTAIANYSKTIDGNGYVIKNMTIEASGNNAGGFFGTLRGTAKNLGFENANVDNTTSYNAGIIAEYSNNGTFENCYVINSSVTGLWSGGILGYTSSTATINSCYIENTEIKGHTTGALVGRNSNTASEVLYITNSKVYNASSNGTAFAGGVIGSGLCDIDNVEVQASLNESASYSGLVIGNTGSKSSNVNNIRYNLLPVQDVNLYGGDTTNLTFTNVEQGTLSPNEKLIIHDKTGDLTGTIDVNDSTSISDIFTSLSAYGIVGSIDENGVISLNSTNGNYISGSVADQLGIGAVNSGSSIIVGATATSSDSIKYITETVATLDSKVLDFAIHNQYTINGSITESGVTGTTIGISTVEDLINLANLVNSGVDTMDGKTFILQNDIDLSSVENWTSIGNASNAFQGNFEGCNYTIYNLYQTIPESPTGTVYAGLFGHINNSTASIRYINMENIYISGTVKNGQNIYAGAVAGYAYCSGFNYIDVSNVNIDIKREYDGSPTSYIGGAAGYVSAYYIGNAYVNSGSVNYEQTKTSSTTNYTGGIYGYLNSQNSGASGAGSGYYNNATVSSNVGYIGGIVGSINSGVRYAANTGDVSGATAGGLFGQLTTSAIIEDSYNMGTISGTVFSETVGFSSDVTFNNCGALSRLEVGSGSANTYNNSQIGKSAIMSYFSGSNWDQSSGVPVPSIGSTDRVNIRKKIGNTRIATITISSATTFADLFSKLGEYGINCSMEDGVISIQENGDYYASTYSPLGFWEDLGFTIVQTTGTIPKTATSTLAVTCTTTINEASTLADTKYVIDGSISASGVTGTVIGISTVADLQNLANLVNAGTTMSGKTFMLMNDIDLSGVANWTAIGNDSSKYFAGTFDGMGYTISNMNIEKTITSSSASYEGLFGYIANSATVKNVVMQDANIDITNNGTDMLHFGTVVGNSLRGNIKNIEVKNSTINTSGLAYTGGAVGKAEQTNIQAISTSGTLYTNNSGGCTGGVVGWHVADSSHITDMLQNDMSVESTYTHSTGGIFGALYVMGGTVNISNTLNNGDFKSADESASIIGGIRIQTTDAYTLNINNAINTKSIVNVGSNGIAILKSTIAGASTSGIINFNNCASRFDEQPYYISSTASSYYNSITINKTNYTQLYLPLNGENLDLSTVIDANFDTSKWSRDGQLLIGDEYDIFVTDSSGALVEKLDFNGNSSATNVINDLSDYANVSLANGKISSTANSGYILTGAGTSFLNTELTDKTPITMTSDTTLTDLGITSDTIITLRATGTTANISITVQSTSTVGDVMTQLAAYGFESSIADGKLTIKSADNDYFIYNATSTLENALKINFSSGVSYNTAGTIYSCSTTSNRQVLSSSANIDSNTKFSQIGIDSNETITIQSGNEAIVYTIKPDSTIGSLQNILSANGIATTINDGYLTIYGNDDSYISAMSNNLMRVLHFDSVEDLQSTQATLVNTNSNALSAETVSVQTQMTSDAQLALDKTEMLSRTLRESCTLEFDTKMNQLWNATSNEYITINSNGTLHTITVEPTDTVGEMLNAISGYGIVATLEDGIINIQGTRDNYVAGMTSGLMWTLNINIPTAQYEAVYTNTVSDTLSVEGTATLNKDTTFTELGAAGDTFITIVSAGTEHVITVKASDTVGNLISALSPYSIACSINDGKITLTPTGYSYIKGMSEELKGYLALPDDFYTETEGTVGHATSSAFEEVNTIKAEASTELQNLINELGNAPAGYDIEVTTNSGAGLKTYTHTFSATSTIQDVIDKLKEYGITAELTPDGRFDISSTLVTDFDITGNLGDFLMDGYTKIYNETNIVNTSTILAQNTESFMDDSTKLSDIGITDGDIEVLINDEIKTITVDSTSSVGDFRLQLAGLGLSSNIIEGKISILTDKDISFSTPTDGSNIIDILGLNNITSESGYSQTSKWLGESGTSDGAASMSSLISELKDSSGNLLGIKAGKLYVYQDGTRSVININTNESLQDLATKLSQYGITMGIDSTGKLYFDGNNNSYLTTDGLTSSEATDFLTKLGIDNNWSTRYNSTSETLDYEELENTSVNGSTLLSDLQDADGNNLGITEGTYYVYQNGVRNTETINSDTTVNDFISTLSTYGMTASFDENGALSVGADSNTYLATSVTSGDDTNLVSVLFETWNFTNIYTSNGLDVPTDVTVAVSETTKLADINEVDSEGNKYKAGYITVVKDGIETNIELTADDTVGDLMDELALYGFETVINSNGQLIIKNTGDSLLQAYSADANFASNALEILGVGLDDWVSTNTYESAGASVVSTTTSAQAATRDTLLSDLGVTAGEYYIYNNGVKYTALVSTDETVGSLMDTLKSFGLETSLQVSADGTKSVIKVVGNGNAYVKSSTNTGSSNVVDVLFDTDAEAETYSYRASLALTNTNTSMENYSEDTLLSTFDDIPNNKSAAGNLSVTIDGVDSLICIEADETIGSLLNKFETLGLEADYIDGNIIIQSGYKDFTINTAGTTSSIMDTIGLQYVDDMGNYLASSSIVEQTTSEVVEKTISAASYANDDTTLDLLNITAGTLSIYRNGQRATITIDPTKDFRHFKSQVASCLAGDIIVEIGDDGYMTFYTNTPDVKIEVGATTDTSNFAAITGITNDGSGIVKSARELYCVNSSSKIMQSGIFRKGDVKEGTFTIGDAQFTIGSNTTIANIISQINASQEANATAYWDSVDGKLVIQSRTTGSALINIEAGTSNFTDILGLTNSEWEDADSDGHPDIGESEATVTKLNVNSQEIGDNAVFTINGTYYTSTSNTIDSAVSKIKGLTIDLKGVSEGETTITVERDKESLANAVSDVVDAYNALIEGVDKEIAKGSPLDDQFGLKLLRNQIRSMMTNTFANSGVFKNLDQIGVSLDKASANNISTERIDTLNFDKNKFFEAYDADRDSLKTLLVGTDASLGLFRQLEENIIGNALTYASGYFSAAERSYNKDIQRLNDKILKAQQAVDRYKERLEAKFNAMDLLISKMQNQYSSFLGV